MRVFLAIINKGTQSSTVFSVVISYQKDFNEASLVAVGMLSPSVVRLLTSFYLFTVVKLPIASDIKVCLGSFYFVSLQEFQRYEKAAKIRATAKNRESVENCSA